MPYTYSLHWNGATGSKSQDSGAEYDAVYRVITDDADDQSQRVIEWFEANVLAIGTAYSYANDSDPLAVAKSIKPKRESGSTTIWVVTVHYAPTGPGEFIFEFIPEDLEFRCQDITITTIQNQVPVEDAIYRGGFTGDAKSRVAVGATTAVMNSAFVPFNPGLEMEEAGLAVRTVHRLKTVDGTAIRNLMNSVNSELFVLNHCGLQLMVFGYQARIVSAGLAMRSEDGKKYRELPLTMEIWDRGWRDKVIDRGTAARALHGDPDGRGGTISPGDSSFTIPGVPKLRELVDNDETPISDPVLFDGNGQPLDLSTTTTPVLLTYQKYKKEIDFRAVSFYQGLLS